MSTNSWYDADLAVVDVETTGLDAANERIIEIAIIHMKAGEVLESWGQLVQPGRDIPAEVTKLTGITQEDVEGKPTFQEIAEEVYNRLEGKVVVAYNLSFDRGFIKAELERSGSSWPEGPALDPLVFARELQKKDGSKKLGAVAARLGIELKDAHRATDDATVAGHVLYAFKDQLPDHIEDLLVLQSQWAEQQERQMARWRNRRSGQESATESEAPAPAVVDTDPQSNALILGPAYIYGTEPDPLRFLYSQLPDTGARRK